jgi:uncharacterized membrane protein YeiH
MAGVRARLDFLGVIVLAVIVGLAGGITRDLLIGVPPATFRDWRYLAVAGGAHGPAAPIIGAAVGFVIRLANLTLGLNLPRARRSHRD